jgi:adenosylcobyric acid synthase
VIAPVLMVQGTASSVGKSTLVAGLCRLFARQGLHVAPFKAQNMSNNAAVCESGGEIGRAQYAQALAAGVQASVDMNPILLKPQSGACQVVVRGQVVATQTAAEYFGKRRLDLWPVITDALDRLRATHDLIVAEGAGSPAEINLRDRDIVNMRVAQYAHADVLLVADIDRGGAFASLRGTWQWLEAGERDLLRGFILNKFRGDASLLSPAPELLEQRTGVPVVGVVPFIDNLGLPDEDAASLTPSNSQNGIVQVGIVRLPHIANFDEFSPLMSEHGVETCFVTRPEELRAPDLVILPGTKSTIADLRWLRERGLADRICYLKQRDTPVLGVCGGYQMLGRCIRDPLRLESDWTQAEGLRIFPFDTVLRPTKQLTRINGTLERPLRGVWQALAGASMEGYEIHMGTSEPASSSLLDVTDDGACAGTYIHGLLERAELRQALVRTLASRRGFNWRPGGAPQDVYDRLADVLAAHLHLRLPIESPNGSRRTDH